MDELELSLGKEAEKLRDVIIDDPELSDIKISRRREAVLLAKIQEYEKTRGHELTPNLKE